MKHIKVQAAYTFQPFQVLIRAGSVMKFKIAKLGMIHW